MSDTLPPSPAPESAASAEADDKRLDKVLARAGICSRRDAKKLVAEARVTVNGKPPESPGAHVADSDIVVVDGKPIAKAEQTRLWRYHKPPGLVTTHRDPQGRTTVFERLPEGMPRVISVGRLDLNSEGLLLLTNDGALARRLELPSTGWVRRYRVRVHGDVDPAQLLALEKGLRIDGESFGPIKAMLERQQGSNAWLTISLKEGKNREVRRVMQHLGWPVTRLIRVAYGPFQLGQLEVGAVEEVPGKVLRDQLGAKPEAEGTKTRANRRRPS